ncbi:MFS transporter [Asanoa sp. NPDC050611]|uniref:MFS transporter n=1 Tax=Asanoa sp. NPDC050611 TaxID=3157098 RepID=UPI0033C5A3D5
MRKWSPLLAVCLGTFLLLVDVTVVVVALPAIGDRFAAGLSGLQWVLDGYALALAALLLGAGSLADRYGRRRAYLVGLGLFAVSSLLCAVAPDARVLVAGRMLQGVGGAAMFATTVAILHVSYHGRDRGVAFGVWGAVNGAAAAAGPLVGGLLTEHAGWRWIFLVNLPVCALAAWITRRAVSESRAPRTGGFDLPGTVTFTVAAGATTYGLIRGGDAGWTDPVTLGAFVVAALTAVAFGSVERRRPHPMLDLALFRRPAFAAMVVAALLAQAAAFAYLPFTTVWLQQVLGHGPVDAGLLGALPMSAAALVVGAAAGARLQRWNPRWTVGVGLLLVAAGDLLQSTVDAASTGAVLVPGLIVAGLGVGAVLPTLSSAVLAAVPRDRSGMAGGTLNTARQLGFALGVAIFGTVFQHAVTSTPGDPHTAFAAGLSTTLQVAAAVAAAGAVLALILIRRPAPPADDATRQLARPATTPA